MPELRGQTLYFYFFFFFAVFFIGFPLPARPGFTRLWNAPVFCTRG